MSKWGSLDSILEGIESESYYTCEFGMGKVKLSEIIALSRPFDEIIDDSNMRFLRDNVQKNGWNDPFPQTLHLIRLLGGMYSVGDGGGNHRVLLACELGFEEVEGHITVMLPKKLVPDETKQRVEELDKEDSEILVRLRNRNLPLNEKEVLWGKLEAIEENKQQLFRNIIIALGWEKLYR